MRRFAVIVVVLAGLTAAGVGIGLSLSGPSPVAAIAPTPRHPFHGAAAAKTVPAASSAASPAGTNGCAAGTSSRVAVPSLHITAPLVSETVTGGQLGIPADVDTVGWWSGGGQLDGSNGTVLVAGHVDWVGQGDGALYPLAQIQPGATICLTAPTGTVSSWVATSAFAVVKAALPQSIFSPTGPRRLVLVTCGGAFDPTTGHYADNVIVEAAPAQGTPA
jgi:Sortase domain